MRNYFTAAISALVIATGAMATTAMAQTDNDGYLAYHARMAAPEDVYYLFQADRKEIVSYKSDRIVRICVGDSRHAVNLEVFHDGEATTVEKNDCVRIEAKEVAVEPAKRLEANEVIVVRAQTLS